MESQISCPQNGIYRSLKTIHSPLPISACSMGFWSVSIGCDQTNTSELILSASCRHETVPEVEVMTSIKGICLASWYTDHHRFQRTLILYEKRRAFCLVRSTCQAFFAWKQFSLDSTIKTSYSQLDPIRIELFEHCTIVDQYGKYSSLFRHLSHVQFIDTSSIFFVVLFNYSSINIYVKKPEE